MDADKSAFVYVAITFIMLFRVQQSERSCSVQRSWECDGQICNLHHMRSRHSRVLTSKILELTQAAAEMPCDTFLSCNNYHTNLITVKESNCRNKVHIVETHYMVVYN